MKNKFGFTLIELMVVVGIIALMTVLTIPFFARYGSRSEFNLRTIEAKSLIEQMNNMAKNPEQGITRYVIKSSGTSVELYKTDATAANLIKKVDFPGYSISATTNNYLVCDSPGDSCCIVTAATDTCSTKVNGTNFFTLVGGNSGDDGTATFNISSNPFRVNYYTPATSGSGGSGT